jgi:glycosyltransferase involved in cell wall biosynthesis
MSSTISTRKDSLCQRRVSIAMATFNGERFIKELLDSLAEQTLLPMELVITDDGSTDRTIEIAQLFAATAPFTVKIFSNIIRLGYPDNFLRAASLCEGELISFCDQDDVWLPDKLLICSKQFEDDNVAMCACDAYIVDETGTRLGHTLLEYTKITPCIYPTTTFPPFAIISGLTQIFRRDILHFFDNDRRCDDLYLATGGASHDAWITFVSSVSGSISVISTPLVLYRQHGHNSSGDHSKRRTFRGRLSSSLKNGADEASKKAAICQQRRDILNSVNKGETIYSYNLCISARFYNQLHCIFHNHECIYSNSIGSIKRIYKIIGMIYRHNYSQGKLGWRAALKDLLFTITKPLRDRGIFC